MEGGTNYVHIDDVVAGHIAAAQQGRSSERYILGGGNLDHHQSFTILTKIVGRRPPWLKIPRWMIEPTAVAIEWLHPLIRLPFDSSLLRLSRYYLYCDTSKARRELDLPVPRPFRQAAQETYNWYRERGVI